MSAQTTGGLWQTKGACRGPQSAVFFPPSSFERKDEKEAREARAKTICASCTVRQPCLDYAIEIRESHGIWGGLNEQERRQLTTAPVAVAPPSRTGRTARSITRSRTNSR